MWASRRDGGDGMTTTKRFVAAAVLATTGVLLAACGDTDGEGNPKPAVSSPHYVDLPDGRSVLCVWEMSTSGGGGLSCDWANAKAAKS